MEDPPDEDDLDEEDLEVDLDEDDVFLVIVSTLRLGTRVGCWGLDGKLKVTREFLNLISKDSVIKPIKEGFFLEIGASYFGTLVYRNDLMWACQVGES